MPLHVIYDALLDAQRRGCLWQGVGGGLYIAGHDLDSHCSHCGAPLTHQGYRCKKGLPIVMTTCPQCDTYIADAAEAYGEDR